MGSDKSPGNNGLTEEFHVCFFAEIGTLLVPTLNFCHDKGELTSCQKQALITVVDKKGKIRHLDLIDFAAIEDQEGLIFSSDLEKAFDSVNHNFFSVFMKFGFDPDFIQWVKTLLCRF